MAREFLLKQGYEILEANRRFSKFCEIDIIALDKDTLVFAEVKTRKSAYDPLEAITKEKYNHIRNGLYLYLMENPEYKKYRIDAIAVLLKPQISIRHLKNI